MVNRQFGWTGVEVPVIGQGTWEIEARPELEDGAVEALRAGLDLGLAHIDTAEGYGRAQDVRGKAIAGRRRQVFLVTKVGPSNASYEGTLRACERSLKRLRTEWLDLYLLHWPSHYPIAETMRALEALVAAGQTRFIGVSNFNVSQLRAAQAALRNERLACNQVPYHLGARGIERQLLPYCAAHRIAVVGYSPFAHGNFVSRSSTERHILDELVRCGALFRWDVLAQVGERHHRTPRQVALNFLTRSPSVFTIPKASIVQHVRENAGGVGWSLSDYEIAAIDRAFPTPTSLQHWMRRATRRAMRSLTRISHSKVNRNCS